jgi:hypothetical protein
MTQPTRVDFPQRYDNAVSNDDIILIQIGGRIAVARDQRQPFAKPVPRSSLRDFMNTVLTSDLRVWQLTPSEP